EAQQLLKDEPSVAGALADAAVSDHVLVRRHADLFVEAPQLIGGLEGAVLIDRLGPRHVNRGGDVPGPLGRLRHARRREDPAAVLLRRANVNQRAAPDALKDKGLLGPQLLMN